MTTNTGAGTVGIRGELPLATVLGMPGLPGADSNTGLRWSRLLPPVLPRWIVRFLAVPLSAKLAGANATIVIAALGTAIYTQHGARGDTQLLTLMASSLALSLIVSVGLVLAALRPLRYLEQVAEHVSSGDLAARVPVSALADRNIARIGRTFNRVLDELITDRARARRLASEVIRAGDRQRALICRELSESTAQVLAALTFETSALASAATEPAMKQRLEAIRVMTSEALEHVGMLAQAVHPRVLDDLGLVVALKGLARRARETSAVDVEVCADREMARVPESGAAMFYRVAEEAVANALRHGWGERVSITLTGSETAIRLAVSDDGLGFDVAAAMTGAGIGLFMMRERASLAGATFSIESSTSAGTTVQVVLPLRPGVVP
jgi:signal transduction histidine kinase